MRRRWGCWLLVAALAAGCAGPAARPATVGDETDVWFSQHMVPHLRQTTSIVELTRDRITHPELARLAGAIGRQGRAHLELLQAWLDGQGLAPHAHSHQSADNPRRSDLERLSRARGAAFDLAFLEVMTARQRAGGRLAAAELGQGTRPEVRLLAAQLLAEQRAQTRQLAAWRRAWSRPDRRPSPAQLAAEFPLPGAAGTVAQSAGNSLHGAAHRRPARAACVPPDLRVHCELHRLSPILTPWRKCLTRCRGTGATGSPRKFAPSRRGTTPGCCPTGRSW